MLFALYNKKDDTASYVNLAGTPRKGELIRTLDGMLRVVDIEWLDASAGEWLVGEDEMSARRAIAKLIVK